MNTLIRRLAIGTLAAGLSGLFVGPPLFERSVSFDNPAFGGESAAVLDSVRAAMAGRDLPTAKRRLAEAAQMTGDQAFAKERARLQLLADYLEDFWKSVDDGIRSLQAVDELVIGDIRTAVVEAQPDLLVLRVNGVNRRYTRQTLPAKVALTLAERVLKPGAPQNKVFFGTFLLMDGRGDRDLARKLWSEAQQAGVDLADLLPELAGEAVASVPVEIPPLTPIMRKTLAPTSWTLRHQRADRLVREPLRNRATQAAGGQLEIAASDEAGEIQLVYNRRIAANFECRVILQDVGSGQAFGLFAADSTQVAHQVSLPKGSVMIEFARQGGVFHCRLNQKEVAVETRGEAAANLVGMLGVTLTPGAKCTVAWFELQTR